MTPRNEQPQQDDAPKEQDAAPQADSGSTSVTMPALGESVTEGTVTRWLKQEGDQVNADEPLLEVSTDKVDTEIPSPASGVLTKILVSEDETVAVGAELAVIGGGSGDAAAPEQQEAAPQQEQKDEQPQEETPPPKQEQKDEQPQEETPPPKQEQKDEQPQQEDAPAVQSAPAPQAAEAPSGGGAESGDSSAYVTPLVRKLATEHDVDLSTLQGTGVGGRIRKQDVLEAAEKKKQQPAPAAASGGGGGRGPSGPPPRRCAARPRRCRGCARPLPRGWSSHCGCLPS